MLEDIVKQHVRRWLRPTEAEWVAALERGNGFHDYRWGVLWVNSKNAWACGFWAWKPWLMVTGSAFLFLYIKR